MTTHEHNPAVEHEDSDVNIRAIFGFAIGLIAVAAAIHVLVWLLFIFFNAQDAPKAPKFPLAAEAGTRLPPEPRLQTNPRGDLRDLRAQEERWLQSYGWVDRNAGVVHIPIEAAIRQTLERGLPARSLQPASNGNDTATSQARGQEP